MSISIKVINYNQKDEIFYLTITENDRMIDIRKDIQNKSVYFTEKSYNRIGLFIFVSKDLLEDDEKDKNKSKKIIRTQNNSYDLKQKYPEKLNLSTKNDLKFFDSYPYIIKNYKTLTLYCYDLGFQIYTPLANIIEYSSPIIILLFYIYKFFYYDKNQQLNKIQIWTIIMIIFHYTKRVFESIFVHIQINTMECKMFLIECLYYILYFGLYAQKHIFTIEKDLYNNIEYLYVILFFISEINNYHCHIILRKIRLENPNNREIPKGNIFKYVYCANYFWEICSWTFISLFSSINSIYLFTIMGGIIMTLWALAKKEFYDKMLFKKYNRINYNKKAIIPFII